MPVIKIHLVGFYDSIGTNEDLDIIMFQPRIATCFRCCVLCLF